MEDPKKLGAIMQSRVAMKSHEEQAKKLGVDPNDPIAVRKMPAPPGFKKVYVSTTAHECKRAMARRRKQMERAKK